MLNSDWRHAYKDVSPHIAIGETCVITVLCFFLAYWLKPDYPDFTSPGFTYLIFCPLLSGLRYGLIYALLSIIVLGLSSFAAPLLDLNWTAKIPLHLYLELLFIAVIAGEFRNYWDRRLQRLNFAALYLNERFSEVNHAFNMLKHSHDRLEQLQASKVSLRDSISSIRRQILVSTGQKQDLYGLAPLILKNIAHIGSLQGVSIHAVTSKTHQIEAQPLAHIGPFTALDVHNPLLLKSIETGKTAALKLDYIAENERALLLAIPMMDANDNLFGVIAVSKMPFRAFREDNIQFLSVIAGYIGDLLSSKIQPDQFLADEDLQCFYLQCKRCMHDVQSFQLSASLIGIEFSKPQHAEALSRLITRHQRGLDQFIALTNKAGNPILLMILPLTDQLSVNAYLAKLTQAIKAEYIVNDIEALGVHLCFQVLDSQKPLAEALQRMTFLLNIDNVFKSP